MLLEHDDTVNNSFQGFYVHTEKALAQKVKVYLEGVEVSGGEIGVLHIQVLERSLDSVEAQLTTERSQRGTGKRLAALEQGSRAVNTPKT